MTDRPIIFSAPMVKALLDGRKTQTRRLAWGDASFVGDRCIKPGEHISTVHLGSTPVPLTHRPTVWQRVQPGDRLYVREGWAACDQCGAVNYLATINRPRNCGECDAVVGKLRPSIHMPRWTSRLTLTVTEVRRQRLQEISEEDAIAEGVDAVSLADVSRQAAWSRRQDFSRLWDKLHGAGAWESNPEVVALTFTVERRNIDARDAA